MRCKIGFHEWKWFQIPYLSIGMPKRMCMRCGKMEYHK
jgi:hypothetical protein